MTDSSLRDELTEVIDTIESGYEFLLAYAAQGRHTDSDAPSGHGPRDRLTAMASAMADLPRLVRALASADPDEGQTEIAAFVDALERDASVSASAIKLVLRRREIGSQIVDNLNASIHLRALLTDLFLIDEAFQAAKS